MKIKITSPSVRKFLFDSMKTNYRGNLTDIISHFNISKSSFGRYRSGKSLIPERLFSSFMDQLNDSQKEEIGKYIENFSDNFGQIKGGKIAYKINKKSFEYGRKKGAFISKIRRKKSFVFNMEVNQDICEFVGAFIGDGFFNCYNNKLYQVEYSGDSRYDLDYYNSVIIPKINKVIPSTKANIYFVKNKNAIRVVFYSKEFFCFLRDFLGFQPGKKTYTVKIPSKLLTKKLFFYSVVRGIFDTDGCVYFDSRKRYKKKYPRISLCTASEGLYLQLSEYLSEDFKVYSKKIEKRNVYLIEIYGHDQLMKWLQLIGFSNKRHLNRIASMV